MKKSRSQRDESSYDSNACSTSVAVPDKCECYYRFKDMNVCLNNFEKDQERRRFLEFLKKFKVNQGTRSRNQDIHLHPHQFDILLCPYDLCPILHCEEGIWKNLFCTLVKTGCPSGDLVGSKRAIAVKQKVNKNSSAATKKAAKIKSGTMGIWSSKNCVFRHNVPIEQTLREYRENNIYSNCGILITSPLNFHESLAFSVGQLGKLMNLFLSEITDRTRMRLVNKVAILSAAARSSMSNKQTHVPSIIIEPRVTVPRETCATVVNITFDDSTLAQHGGSKIWKPRIPNEKSINVRRKPGMHASSSRSFEMVIKQLFPSTKNGQSKQTPENFK